MILEAIGNHMKETLKKIIFGSTLLVTVSSVPLVPNEMEFSYAYQRPCSYQETVNDSATTTPTENPLDTVADSCIGDFVSKAVFIDHKGNEVYVEIPNTLYGDMGKIDGAKNNPKETEYKSIFEEIAYPATTSAAASATASTTYSLAAGTSVTKAFTVPSGTNTFVATSFTNNTADNQDRVTSVTWNGSAMSLIYKAKVGADATGQYTYIEGYFNGTADGASHNLVINSSASTAYAGTIASWVDVNQTALDNTTTATALGGMPKTLNYTTVANNTVEVLMASNAQGAWTLSSGGTIVNKDSAFGATFNSAAITPAGTNSFVITATLPVGNQQWMMAAFGLAPVSTPSTITPNQDIIIFD